ncbi:MAG: AAA family ATPase [Blastocatellia bacterium]
MRIREIYFHNVRSFRGEHRISFVNPLTGEARPVIVIAGTNGSGKTTIFEAIEALLWFAVGASVPDINILAEIKQTGLVCLALEISPKDYLGEINSPDQILHIVVGRKDLVPGDLKDVWPSGIYSLTDYPHDTANTNAYIIRNKLHESQRIILDQLGVPIPLEAAT